MTHQIKLKDLVEGEKYILIGPPVVPEQQATANKLAAAPHILISSQFGSLRFLLNEEDREVNYYNNSNNENYVRPPDVQFLEISRANLPDGENQLFETVQKSVRNATENRATNQALRNVYESRTNTSASPGEGPANLVRGFLGMKTPKGSMGGTRSRRGKRNTKRVNRRNKKSKSRRSRR